MTLQRLYLLPAAALIAFTIGVPKTVLATTRVVNPSASTCDSTSTTSPCYRSITAAIAAATSGDEVLVEPETYSERITLKNGVSLRGRETARTILSGGGSGTIITADSITTLAIVRNLTLIDAEIGIAVSNSSTLEILNNVFRIGSAGTAITTASSAATKIRNNAFHATGTAIETTADTTLNIINNIFSTYATAFPATIVSGGILDNLFFTGTVGANVDTITNGNITGQDPLFVDPDILDFHLELSTPCRDTGNPLAGADNSNATTADIGAYGGTYADTIPYILSDFVNQAPVQTSPGPPAVYSIDVSWTGNQSYLFTDPTLPGGYRVYYSVNKSGPPYSSTYDAGKNTSATIPNLAAASVPAAPVLNKVEYAGNTLKPSWSEVSAATGYKVHVLDTVTSTTTTYDVSNALSTKIDGLINGRDYTITVTAYTQNTYYFSVTAYDDLSSDPLTPGEDHESAYSAEPPGVTIGGVEESGPSNPITEYPDIIINSPNLPNTGCFIATAAYGYYSAPQVQALREFRDKYLLTNAPGKAFVSWYYAYGPVGARFISDHPGLKPVVRATLLPAVGGAMFMTRTSTLTKTILFVVLGLLALSASLRVMKTRRT